MGKPRVTIDRIVVPVPSDVDTEVLRRKLVIELQVCIAQEASRVVKPADLDALVYVLPGKGKG